jgi:hypothetical protein
MLIASSFAHSVRLQAVFSHSHLISPAASHKFDKRGKPASIPPIENPGSADNSFTLGHLSWGTRREHGNQKQGDP